MRLGDVERKLHPLGRTLEVGAVPVAEPKSCGQRREILVRLVVRDDCESALHGRHGLVAAVREEVDPAEPRGHAGSGVRVAELLVQGDRLTEEVPSGLEVGGSRGHVTSAVEQHCAIGGLVREVGRLLEVASCLSRGSE